MSTILDIDQPWQLDARVALRPESFGALAYHFGTRRLSFLKSRMLYEIVSALGEHPTARDACQAAGVGTTDMPHYERALTTLAASGMIGPR